MRTSLTTALLVALAAAAVAQPAQEPYQRVVVLGIDGMDPDLLAEAIERYPERMANFKRFVETPGGSGIVSLGTSTPPQSPVAWSNFISGRGPGGHGIYDFLHRNPKDYQIVPGNLTPAHTKIYGLPGRWQFPMVSGGDSNRSGRAFWSLLGDEGVPADIWRMPINFPVEGGRGWSFPGMMTPAVDSAYGEPSFYSTDPPVKLASNEKAQRITVRGGVVRTRLLGPNNDLQETRPRTFAELDVYVDEEAGAVAIELQGKSIVLEPGEWSSFLPVTFSMLPMGLADTSGIVRFYLRSISPELELYASPVNVDPNAPPAPVSAPDDAAAELAEMLGGAYYTQGMAEDVNGLKNGMLSDAEFAAQSDLVYQERGAMLDIALERYMNKEEGGFLFFYYSSVDLFAHMMWRHADEQHPHHDPAFAGQDSSDWSGREGSRWADCLMDVYLRMDPVLGQIRETIGEDTLLIIMSDHGFAPYHRKFSLNTWLLENGYLVLKEDYTDEEGNEIKFDRELPEGDLNRVPTMIQSSVDWSKSTAYGIGFNGLYLNLEGREAEGSVKAAEAPALLAKLKAELEAIRDDAPGREGTQVVLSADLATDVFVGARVDEAPDIVVGYNSGYCNSDQASLGRIPHEVLSDNLGKTFNGSHLMDPRVVQGTLIVNRALALDDPRLEDLTVEILGQYGLDPDTGMTGRRVLR